jgi:hypothetical protein
MIAVLGLSMVGYEDETFVEKQQPATGMAPNYLPEPASASIT